MNEQNVKNERVFGSIYFDTSTKSDPRRHKKHNCWRAEFQIGNIRKRKRHKCRVVLEDWLESMRMIYGKE